MRKLFFDFETRSTVDLKASGMGNYATNPSTQVLMMAYAFDEAPVTLWVAGGGFPQDVREHIASGGYLIAHNASFERLIYNNVLRRQIPDLPEADIAQWICTAYMARASNLPPALSDLCRALRMPTELAKMAEGTRLIKIFSKPQIDGTFTDPQHLVDDWHKFCDYCKQDVEAMRAAFTHLEPLTVSGLTCYTTNERINDRGILIDAKLARLCAEMHLAEKSSLLAKLIELTGNVSVKGSGKHITKYLHDRLPPELQAIMVVDTVTGLTMDAATRRQLLARTDEMDEMTGELVKALDAYQMTSATKFQKMLDVCGDDDRVRGAFITNGAMTTGRFSSKIVQVHNLPRGSTDTAVIENMLATGSVLQNIDDEANLSEVLKNLIRPTLMASAGKTFVCSDLSQIEGRILHWVTLGSGNDDGALRKLSAYADPARDVYCETATSIKGSLVTKEDSTARTIFGKIPELALGFGGAHNALNKALIDNAGIYMPETERSEIVQKWREANYWVKLYWRAIYEAAKAVCCGGAPMQVGKVVLSAEQAITGLKMRIVLPSGRSLVYHSVQLVKGEMTALKAGAPVAQSAFEHPRSKLYGGLLVENIVQAIAADVLRSALVRTDVVLPDSIVAHTHDEILIEVVATHASDYAQVLPLMIASQPAWADDDLPLAAETWIKGRYTK